MLIVEQLQYFVELFLLPYIRSFLLGLDFVDLRLHLLIIHLVLVFDPYVLHFDFVEELEYIIIILLISVYLVPRHIRSRLLQFAYLLPDANHHFL